MHTPRIGLRVVVSALVATAALLAAARLLAFVRPLGDAAGERVSGAGDVNGDGLDDFLVSATALEPEDGAYPAGRCYLVLGRERGWHPQVPLATSDVEWAVDITAFDGAQPGEAACYAVGGAGDLNGDGYADIVIGAPESDESAESGGKVYVVFGKGLTLSKRAMRSVVVPGEIVTYTLRYTYTAGQLMSEVRIVDAPPDELEYIACFGGADCGLEGRTVGWNVGFVMPHGSGAVGFTMRVPESLAPGTRITNTALITTPFLVNPMRAAAVVRLIAHLPTPRPSAAPTDTPTATRALPTTYPDATPTATRTPTTPGSPPATDAPTATERSTATATPIEPPATGHPTRTEQPRSTSTPTPRATTTLTPATPAAQRWWIDLPTAGRS